MLVHHVHDRFSALGGADWHLISILERMPSHVKIEGLFGRSDGSVPSGTAQTSPLKLIKNLDKKAPFFAENKVARRAVEFINARQPDLVHVHNILNPHILTRLAKAAPAIITVQDHRFFCPGPGQVLPDGSLCHKPPGPHCKNCFDKDDYFQKVMELVQARLQALAKFQAIIVLSLYMKNALASAGIEKNKIHVIPPFVHGLKIPSTPASKSRAILFAGRIVKTKGVFDLLDAFAKTNINAPLIMAGTGPAEDLVMEKIRDLNLESRVELTGWIRHEKMTGLFEKARVVVMPSIWQEPFGIVGLEAQASARPVVAYDVGGIHEWLQDRVSGTLVQPGNTTNLGQAIQAMLNNPEIADQYGQTGQQIVTEKFNPDRLMADLINVYSIISCLSI
jgi:glycosyltransferase involved in cell wall biosynthesis